METQTRSWEFEQWLDPKKRMELAIEERDRDFVDWRNVQVPRYMIFMLVDQEILDLFTYHETAMAEGGRRPNKHGDHFTKIVSANVVIGDKTHEHERKLRTAVRARFAKNGHVLRGDSHKADDDEEAHYDRNLEELELTQWRCFRVADVLNLYYRYLELESWSEEENWAGAYSQHHPSLNDCGS